MVVEQPKALRMIRGTGRRLVTHYNCGAVDDALKMGCNILVVHKGKMTERKPRRVHRKNLLATFCTNHEKAGRGKWIDNDAYDEKRQSVIGAHRIHPYLNQERCGATIVDVFLSLIGHPLLTRLQASILHTRELGQHLHWRGKRDATGALLASPWITGDDFWQRACESNRNLLTRLDQTRCGRTDLEPNHNSPKKKFLDDIEVLRRATRVVNVSTGKMSYQGGATPYSKPLEQCEFAIDKYHLTADIGSDGIEITDNYYRFVIGRAHTCVLSPEFWGYEGSESRVAFISEQAKCKYKADKKKRPAA